MSSGSSLFINPDELLNNDYDPDGDVISFVGAGTATSGQVTFNGVGDILYTPNDEFFGYDSFDYTISDGQFESTATVSVYVEDNYLAFDVQGTSDNDVLFGDIFGENSIYGGGGNDILLGGFYSDSLAGGSGNDLILGLFGEDVINGGAGNDILLGGNGNDTISGDIGNDILFGGRGQDTFLFSQGDGADQIADYDAGRSTRRFTIAGDQIEIDYDGINHFNDLLGFGYQDGRNTVFDFGDGDMLILSRTRLASLDDDAFTFV